MFREDYLFNVYLPIYITVTVQYKGLLPLVACIPLQFFSALALFAARFRQRYTLLASGSGKDRGSYCKSKEMAGSRKQDLGEPRVVKSSGRFPCISAVFIFKPSFLLPGRGRLRSGITYL